MWPPHPYLMIGGAIASLYGLYRFATYREARIWVKEKHLFGSGTSLLFMGKGASLLSYGIVTSDNRFYRIPYSVLSWQWNPHTMWGSVQPGTVYRIRYWGIHCPLLGLYPNIDHIRVIQETREGDAEKVKEMSVRFTYDEKP